MSTDEKPIQSPPEGELLVTEPRKGRYPVAVSGLTLVSDNRVPVDQLGQFLYKSADGEFMEITRWGWADYELERFDENTAVRVYLQHQRGGRLHVPFETAFPCVEVEEA